MARRPCKKVLLLEKDTFSNMAIKTQFLMYGIECDIAFRATYALQLIRQRLGSGDPKDMYTLILIDRGLNDQGDEQVSI